LPRPSGFSLQDLPHLTLIILKEGKKKKDLTDTGEKKKKKEPPEQKTAILPHFSLLRSDRPRKREKEKKGEEKRERYLSPELRSLARLSTTPRPYYA